jgi:hypothetical protein
VLPAGRDLILPRLRQDRPGVGELVRDQAQLTEHRSRISGQRQVQLIRRGRPRLDSQQLAYCQG